MAKGSLHKRTTASVVAAILLSAAASVSAQDRVKIVGVVLSVKHRAGPTGNFAASKVGLLLPPGSRVQTGARSKCALQFPNGGVIRMGQRSDLVIQNPSGTSMQLSRGQLWAKVIAGTTARVEGSHGVAVVKGTEWTFDGETIICYDGDVSYETVAGTTDVPAGYAGTADEDGTVRTSPAPGREYPGGDLIQWFGGMRLGSEAAVTSGEAAGMERKESNIAIDRIIGEAVTPVTGNLNVFVQGGRADTVDTLSSAPARQRVAALADPTRPQAAWGHFPGVDPSTLAPLSISRPTFSGTMLPNERLGQAPGLPDRRYFFGPYTPADVFAYVGDGGSSFGLRVRPHIIWGPVYVEVGATTRASTWFGDGTDITEAFAMLRQDWGEATIGRQRFLEGPVNNSRLGSLLTFETGDALRVQTSLGKLSIDAAYIRKMSPIIGPRSRGWYGRIEHPVCHGLAGVNLVTDEKDGGAGWSFDLALPVIDGELDLYGEVGRDALDRDLHTIGAYFPGLYQSENIDLFLEYADRDELPSLTTLRLYKHFGEDVTAVFSADKASGEDVGFGAGVIWRFDD